MDGQLALAPKPARWSSCGRVALRLRGRYSIAELVCLKRRAHEGAHRFVVIERVRTTDPVNVGGGVL